MRQGALEHSESTLLSVEASVTSPAPHHSPEPISETIAPALSATVAEIFKQVDTVYSVLCKAGIPARPYTPLALQKLLSFSEEQQRQLLSQLQLWSSVITSVEFGGDFDFSAEIAMVEKAVQKLRFQLRNHSWTDTDENQIIEVYNLEGIQLYRSLSFFKTCGYSLLDLCVHEWFILWERPQKVLQEMNLALQSRLTGHTKDPSPGIPPHLVMETYNDGFTQPFLPRAIFVNFTKWYPLYSESGDMTGFILTSTAKVVSEGEESLKFDFI